MPATYEQWSLAMDAANEAFDSFRADVTELNDIGDWDFMEAINAYYQWYAKGATEWTSPGGDLYQLPPIVVEQST